MRVALFGSPSFALPVLEALHHHHELVLAVAQPDKAAGRGMKRRSPPVALRAHELGIALEQPRRVKGNQAFHQRVRELELDLAVTAAYGKILPENLLEIPQHGFLNVHASLLPKYRGAAPIQWALIQGETTTGITIMQTDAGLDTGPIRWQRECVIEPEDTATTLFKKLADLGAEAITEALERLARGELPSTPQDDAQASHAPLLSKEDGKIRWHERAEQIYNRYRGVFAWPGTWTLYEQKPLKVHNLKPAPDAASGAPAGQILALKADGIRVATGEGVLELTEVQPPGKRAMPARDWANGYGVKQGDRFE